MMFTLTPARRAQRLALLAVLAITGWPTLPRASEPCAGASAPCPAATDSVEAFLASDLAAGRLAAPEWSAAPIVVVPSSEGTGARVQTSLRQVGNYANDRLARRIEEAKPFAPKGLVMPKPGPRPSTALDVWTSLNIAGLDQDAIAQQKSSLGADYRLSPNSVVGVAVEKDASPSDKADVLDGRQVATYLALRPAPALALEARALWGETNSAQNGDALATARSGVSATARSEIGFSGLKIAPALTFAHGEERAVFAEATSRSERNTLAVTPRISRPFTLDGGETLEPYATYTSEIDIKSGVETDAAGPFFEASRSAGLGLTFAEKDGSSLSIATELEGLEQAAGDRSVKSHLRLKMPLE